MYESKITEQSMPFSIKKIEQHLTPFLHPSKHVLHCQNCYLHVSRHRTTSQAQNSCKKWNVQKKLSPYYTSLAKSESLSDPLTQCNQALYKRDLQILTQSSHVRIYMLTSFLASMPSWLSPQKKSAVYASQQTHCWRKADAYIQPTNRNKHFYSGNFEWMSVELCHS